MPRYQAVEERFLKYTQETDTCWVWTGIRDSCGYGTIGESPFGDGRRIKHQVTRWLWEYLFHPIPKGKIICHTCDNTSCVNPNHLYVGTAKSNALDREQRNRGGGKSGKVPMLSKKDYLKIHELYLNGTHPKTIAKQLNIHLRTVFRYLNEERHARYYSSTN